jgi:hypothetical protein
MFIGSSGGVTERNMDCAGEAQPVWVGGEAGIFLGKGMDSEMTDLPVSGKSFASTKGSNAKGHPETSGLCRFSPHGPQHSDLSTTRSPPAPVRLHRSTATIPMIWNDRSPLSLSLN